MIVDHPVISRRVFFPRRSELEPNFCVEVGDAHLGCYLCRRYAASGTLIHFHGNGELAAEYATDYAEFFLAMGVNVCFAEYRGYGASTGAPGLGAMLGDGEQIVKALGLPPEQIVAFGRSLGTVYAIELARRLPNLSGLVLESGVAHVLAKFSSAGEPSRFGFTQADLVQELKANFDHRGKLESYRGPQLVLHAEHDRRSHAERLHAWGGGTAKKLVILPNGNHNTILFANYAAYVLELSDFLRQTGVVRVPAGSLNPDPLSGFKEDTGDAGP